MPQLGPLGVQSQRLPTPKNTSHQRLTIFRATGYWVVMLIYKIFRADEWQNLQRDGATPGAPIDVADGFIHFSTAAQARETAAKHFAGVDGLVLLACDADAMGDALRWEVSRGGADFPHLYREFRMGDVVWDRPLPLGPDGHIFPDDLA